MTPKQHALKVAASKVLADIVTEGYEQLRKEAEPVFGELRRETGSKSLDVSLPDGSELGTVAILAGKPSRVINFNTLAAIVINDDPDEFVEEIRPEALRDEDLIQFVRDHMPHLIVKKIRDSHLKDLIKRIDGSGYLKDAAGTQIKVAEVDRADPTGEFRYRASAGARAAVWKAWQAGELQPLIGDLLRPQITGGES